MGVFSTLFFLLVSASDSCTSASRALVRIQSTASSERSAYPTVKQALFDSMELSEAPTPEFLEAFDLVFSSWSEMDESTVVIRANSRPLSKIHPAFKLPPDLLEELLRSLGKILKYSKDTQKNDLHESVFKTVQFMAPLARKSKPVRLFFEEVANEALLNTWLEIKTAAWFIEQGYDLLWFRRSFFVAATRHRGEIDLVVRSSDGRNILVEVKNRLHRKKNYRIQFDRYFQVLSGEISLGMKIDEVLIFVPEGYSEHELQILKSSWPDFQIGALPRH